MRRYCIVGNGIAGATAASRIRELDRSGEIHIFTDEAHSFYARTRLPEIITGAAREEDLVLQSLQWYKERQIHLHLGEAVQKVVLGAKQALTSLGNRHSFDVLLLANGSRSFVPPIQGAGKEGVFTLRSMSDALKIKECCARAKKGIVVGGGLLGLEAGNGLRKAGLPVTVLEIAPRLLPRQLDEAGARVLRKQMEQIGFTFYLGAQVEGFIGDREVKGVTLKSGETLEGELVLVSAGVRPNLDLARDMGLKIDKAVVVDDRMQTSAPDVFAAGDVAEHRGVFYGIWPASERQGQVAGINMAGGDERYEGTTRSNTLKVAGIDLMSAGEIDVEGKFESLVERDDARYTYRKLVFEGNTLKGCIFLGNTRGARSFLGVIETRRDLGSLKKELLKPDFDLSRLR